MPRSYFEYLFVSNYYFVLVSHRFLPPPRCRPDAEAGRLCARARGMGENSPTLHPQPRTPPPPDSARRLAANEAIAALQRRPIDAKPTNPGRGGGGGRGRRLLAPGPLLTSLDSHNYECLNPSKPRMRPRSAGRRIHGGESCDPDLKNEERAVAYLDFYAFANNFEKSLVMPTCE